MLFIGVDPGVSGGIAVISEVGNVVTTIKMPETDRYLYDFIGGFAPGKIEDSVRAVLERAGASPQMGVTSAFTFGRNYGLVRMAVIAAGIPFDVITPQQWQKVMGCRSGGDKNITKARAQQLFPSVKVTHAIADALLLAEFCRRMETGEAARRDGLAALIKSSESICERFPKPERGSLNRGPATGELYGENKKAVEGIAGEITKQVSKGLGRIEEAIAPRRRARAAKRAAPQATAAGTAARR